MSLKDIFQRNRAKQLDTEPEEGGDSELMAGNDAVRKKQLLYLGCGGAVALVLGSWYVMGDDAKLKPVGTDGKEVKITTDDMVNRNMSQREWQAASEAQMQSINNQLKGVDGQRAQMEQLQAQIAALQGEKQSMASDGQRVMSAYQQENDQLRQQIAQRNAAPAAPAPTQMYGPGQPNYRTPGAPMTAGEAAAAAVSQSRSIKLVSFEGGPRAPRLGSRVARPATPTAPITCRPTRSRRRRSSSASTPRRGAVADRSAAGDPAHHRPGALGLPERQAAHDADRRLRHQRRGARRSLFREGLCEAAADDLSAGQWPVRGVGREGLHQLRRQDRRARPCRQSRGLLGDASFLCRACRWCRQCAEHCLQPATRNLRDRRQRRDQSHPEHRQRRFARFGRRRRRERSNSFQIPDRARRTVPAHHRDADRHRCRDRLPRRRLHQN